MFKIIIFLYSATTIYGHQTKFADELSVGDAIIITVINIFLSLILAVTNHYRTKYIKNI